uniref:DUF1566 domain-containing protein n=1 Tax=Dulem virus 29 TaxID=3145747 RepID=A0AAU8B2F7_9CAUD
MKLTWIENKGVLIEIDGEIPHKFIVFKRDIEEKKDWWDGKKACEDIFCRMTTSQELSIIYENKEEINKLMTENGGEPLKEDFYWSSSEYSYNSAWSQSFSNGSIYRSYGKSDGNYVRPVLAF